MRSVFLSRILVLIVIVILVAALLMTGGYIYFSRDAYTAIKLAELTPEAEAMGQIYVEHARGLLDEEAFHRLLDKLMEAADATGTVVDSTGAIVYDSIEDREFETPAYRETVHEQLGMALQGEAQESNAIRMRDNSAALSVCIPIRDGEGAIIGAVYLLQSPAEIRRTTNRLSNSLILVIIVVVPIMLLFSSLGVRRMTEPLRRMSEVALEMSRGNFAIRADEEEVGEVGLLARALNTLCDTLSQTIHQLRAEKSQLRHVLASLSEGVAATDSVGCLTIYNPALMHMFGAVRVGTRQELIADEEIWNAFDEVYRTGQPTEMRYTYAGDRMIWISLTPILSDEGERTGVVGLFRDMTEMENQERSRRDYIQNISHELRTPLTAMRGLLEPMLDGMVTEESDRQRYYKIMHREVMRLSRLITDMMQLSRLQSGTEYMEIVEVNVNELLEDFFINYNKEAAQRGITLKLDMPKLPHVLTDPDRIEQILVILFSNAMRYTPEGGEIILHAEEHARVNVSMIDTGSGIPEGDLPNIFDRFYTVDKARKEGNTGLGLSIAQQMIEKLGEKIMVQSAEGKGSQFTFTLKKYVSNAIALGPAQEEWQQDAEPIDLFPEDVELPTPEDAPYVVLPEEKKEKPKPVEKRKQGAKGKGDAGKAK